MKATDLLKSQHEEVDDLFSRIESAGDREKMQLREELADKLVAHSVIEKEIFYPEAAEALEEEELGESLEEHALTEYQLRRFLEARPGDADFDARCHVLKEIVHHHVEEEQDELFPRVEDACEEAQLEDMGKRLELRFDECLEQGHRPLLAAALEMEGVAPPGRRARRRPSRAAAKRAQPQRAPAKRGAKRAAPSRGRPSKAAASRGGRRAKPSAGARGGRKAQSSAKGQRSRASR